MVFLCSRVLCVTLFYVSYIVLSKSWKTQCECDRRWWRRPGCPEPPASPFWKGIAQRLWLVRWKIQYGASTLVLNVKIFLPSPATRRNSLCSTRGRPVHTIRPETSSAALHGYELQWFAGHEKKGKICEIYFLLPYNNTKYLMLLHEIFALQRN